MRIVIGVDTRAEPLRATLLELIAGLGHEVSEFGADSELGIEYPEIAIAVARKVCDGEADRGVLMGRTGMSMCLVANKFPRVRAAVCSDELMAEMSRLYLDLNVLCLSAELLSVAQVEQIVIKWLEAPFEGGRHAERLRRIGIAEREAALYFQESATH